MKQRKLITVYVNDRPIEHRHGATVEQTVIAYDQKVWKVIRKLRAWVVDARGSRVGLGGALQDGARLYIRYANNPCSPNARKI